MADTTQPTQTPTNEAELRALIARWSQAVRDQDLAGIRAHHDPDILMFDVPPPFFSVPWAGRIHGDVEIRRDLHTARPVQFDFHDIAVNSRAPRWALPLRLADAAT